MDTTAARTADATEEGGRMAQDAMTTVDGDFEYGNPQAAFQRALTSGRLTQQNVGDYMYMGTKAGRDLFKHSSTRQYIA